MADPAVTAVPRRVAPAARITVAVLVGVPPGSLFVALLRTNPEAAVVPWAGGAALTGLSLGILLALNCGYLARMRGSLLEVSTLFGRQTVDLAALVSVGYHPGRYGRHGRSWLRLSDAANTVTIRPPRPTSPEVHNAVSRGVWEAAGRGVTIPSQVPGALGLPPLTGVADGISGVASQLATIALVMAAIGVSVGIGLVAAQLGG